MILVSACLVGINCKYNGGNNYNEKIFNMVKNGEAIPLCAEQLGGLTTPRIPVEIKMINGKKHALNKEGKGAKEILELAKKLNIKKAILQPRSPSCGVGKIYSGNFDGQLVDGNGFLAEILIENGIEVLNVDEI